jgi:hypothetical protein
MLASVEHGVNAPHGALCAALLPHGMAADIAALRVRAPLHPSLERYAIHHLTSFYSCGQEASKAIYFGHLHFGYLSWPRVTRNESPEHGNRRLSAEIEGHVISAAFHPDPPAEVSK